VGAAGRAVLPRIRPLVLLRHARGAVFRKEFEPFRTCKARRRVGVSYYRSQRVPDENTSATGVFAPGEPGVQQSGSDYVLAGGRGLNTPFNFIVVSPVFAPPDGNQAGFNGDYSGLVINKGEEAHPIWSDTRNVNPFPLNGSTHDEDVFTMSVQLP
jgi:hypothetical protein